MVYFIPCTNYLTVSFIVALCNKASFGVVVILDVFYIILRHCLRTELSPSVCDVTEGVSRARNTHCIDMQTFLKQCLRSLLWEGNNLPLCR
jgi:hypothetical protein